MKETRDEFKYRVLTKILDDLLFAGGELSFRSKERTLLRPEKTAEGTKEVPFAKATVLTTVVVEAIEDQA